MLDDWGCGDMGILMMDVKRVLLFSSTFSLLTAIFHRQGVIWRCYRVRAMNYNFHSMNWLPLLLL